jgi:hypothetical protein
LTVKTPRGRASGSPGRGARAVAARVRDHPAVRLRQRARRQSAAKDYNAEVMRNVGVVVVALWVCACSSSNGTGTTPSDLSSTGKARLADYCAKRDACAVEQNLTITPCPTSMCIAGQAEEAPVIEFFDCQIAKQCSSFFSDDDCAASAGSSDAERDAFIARCLAKTTECANDFGDVCALGLPLARKELMRAADACMSRACADVQTCVNAIVLEDCWG